MDPNAVANIRAVIVVIISGFISLRAFYLYNQARSPRLFILALSMLDISLTTTVDAIGNSYPILHLNAYWYNYFGQDASFLFIVLSLMSSKNIYLRSLMRWSIIISSLLLVLVLLGPTLPSTFTNIGVFRALLSGISRGVLCLIIFFCYISAFFTKESLFSLLMSTAFLLISVGCFVLTPRYVLPHQELLQNLGDIIRIFGFSTLLIAVLRG